MMEMPEISAEAARNVAEQHLKCLMYNTEIPEISDKRFREKLETSAKVYITIFGKNADKIFMDGATLAYLFIEEQLKLINKDNSVNFSSN